MEVGIAIRDLDLLTIGVIQDMWTETANYGVEYRQLATQEQNDRF